MSKTFITKSAEETQKIARELAATMQDGEILLLFGNLGAGKTTFMQGFAKGLGITQRIISPTFIIAREYEVRSMKHELTCLAARRGIKNLFHLDLYRITSEHDLEGLGIEEILNDKEAIVAIEWPEKLGNLIPEKRIEIHFETLSDQERKIIINKM